MQSQDRSALLSRAFRDVQIVIAGRHLRPPTAGSLDLLQQIGNPLFVEADDETPAKATLLPLFEFIWVHTADLNEVLEAAELEGEIRRKARVLAFETPVEDVNAFTEAFNKLQVLMQAAMTEVVPEGDGGKPAPSRTGSLSSSSPSVVPAIPSASASSSGSAPSGAPSLTSTPPTDTTDPFADGPATSMPPGAIPLPSLPPPSIDGVNG
jgi:hypothetical protein